MLYTCFIMQPVLFGYTTVQGFAKMALWKFLTKFLAPNKPLCQIYFNIKWNQTSTIWICNKDHTLVWFWVNKGENDLVKSTIIKNELFKSHTWLSKNWKPQKSHQFVDLLSCYSDNGFNSKIQTRNLNSKNIEPNITDSKYFPLHNISYLILYYEYVLSNARVISSNIT